MCSYCARRRGNCRTRPRSRRRARRRPQRRRRCVGIEVDVRITLQLACLQARVRGKHPELR
jgi:hypothetical protein